MKEVHCRLLDLPILHPRLLWETIILAGASVLEGVDRRAPYTLFLRRTSLASATRNSSSRSTRAVTTRSRLSDCDEPSNSRGRSSSRPSPSRRWPSPFPGDMRSSMSPSGGAPRTTWWVTHHLASKSRGVRAGRTSNPPGSRSGIGSPSRVINPASYSWSSSRPSRGDWDLLEVSHFASLLI